MINDGWISVDDKHMPPSGEWYLVYQRIHMRCLMRINNEWFNAKEEKYGKITHWRELPRPPVD